MAPKNPPFPGGLHFLDMLVSVRVFPAEHQDLIPSFWGRAVSFQGRAEKTSRKLTHHNLKAKKTNVSLGLSPLPVTVTTRVITFLVGDPYKPSFATVTGSGDNPMYPSFNFCFCLNFLIETKKSESRTQQKTWPFFDPSSTQNNVLFGNIHMDVSKNRGPQNGWFIMEHPIKMGWFGCTPIFGNTHMNPSPPFKKSKNTLQCSLIVGKNSNIYRSSQSLCKT